MKRPEHCLVCGGTEFVDAVDNSGRAYKGCARCVIVLPPELKTVAMPAALTWRQRWEWQKRQKRAAR